MMTVSAFNGDERESQAEWLKHSFLSLHKQTWNMKGKQRPEIILLRTSCPLGTTCKRNKIGFQHVWLRGFMSLTFQMCGRSSHRRLRQTELRQSHRPVFPTYLSSPALFKPHFWPNFDSEANLQSFCFEAFTPPPPLLPIHCLYVCKHHFAHCKLAWS